MGEKSSLIVLGEISVSNCKTRIFLRYGNLEKPVHVSSLYGRSLREVVFQGNNVEYTLDVRDVRGLELYEVVYLDGASYTELYEVVEVGTKYLGRLDKVLDVSTGSEKLDRLVNEVSEYRAFWATKMCNASIEMVKSYNAILKANTALNYYLFKRLKGTWQSLSNEYLGFAYTLTHTILVENGLKHSKEHLREVCRSVEKCEEPVWRGIVVNYEGNGLGVNISLEKRVGSAIPDLLISTRRGPLVVECKQGPPKVWLLKAIKQAKKYKWWLPGVLLLLTPRELSSEERKHLLEYYNYVVDGCDVKSFKTCRDKLKDLLEDYIKKH